MLWICAPLLLGLHLLLPFTAARLIEAEPSFAGEIFPWLPVPTKESLGALQTAAGQWRTCVPFVLVCAGLLAVYAKMFRALRGVQSLKVQAFVFAAGAAALLSYVFSPVMFSSDIFAYAMYGRAMSEYGGNPYSATMAVPDTDPFYVQFGQEYLPSWYGPLWTFLSAAATRLTGAHLGATVLVFRLISIVFALITSGFIWSCLRKYSPENAARGLVLFLWNPLLVMETGMSGHNDPVMLALVVLGVWLHLRGCKASAVMALTLSALVKFLTGMLIPLYMLLVLRESRTWRERVSFVLRSAIPACAVALIAFHLAKADTDVPVAHSATAPDFYMNNFHELIFKGLRVAVGGEAESAEVSVYFYPHWLRLREGAELRTAKSASAPVLRRAEAGEHLLLIAPGNAEWLRVYDPMTHQEGYVTG
ncbi:MAG: polyprenol phosphomannose-dependent alpha 1,6 mannosyltransferase MptB, partial [Chthoniobacteraceae bacterium]